MGPTPPGTGVMHEAEIGRAHVLNSSHSQISYAVFCLKKKINPLPDPDLPFLGRPLTKRNDGGVLAGPNPVLALTRAVYRKTNVRPSKRKQILLSPAF